MGRISEETIQKVAAANDIVEVIGGYVPLKKAGGSFRALCPFHREKTPSFHVNPQRQIFHCFGCGVGGSVFRFVMMYENLDFVPTVRKLAERAGIPIVEDAGAGDWERGADQRARLLKIHEAAAAWFHANLMKSADAAPARAYLQSRGITRQTAVEWKLGYAPDSLNALQAWALGAKMVQKDLVLSGLIKERESGGGFHDRFRGRLMFPICNDAGGVIAFSGRTLKSDPKVPKYLNSPETPIFKKGRVLFGLHKSKRAIIEADEAVVLEGQLDLITCYEAGIRNVVAPQGTAFTLEQARTLRRYAGGVILCFDCDVAGQNAAEKSYPALLETNFAVKVAVLPEAEDPDSLVRKAGADAFREILGRADDFFSFFVARTIRGKNLGDPRIKLAAAERLTSTISLVSDPVLRDDAVTRASAALGVAAAELRKKLKSPATTRLREDEALAPKAAQLKTSRGIYDLCLFALHSAETRDWLRGQGWNEVLDQVPGAEPLRLILARLKGNGEAALTVFMAEVEDPLLESFYTQILSQRPPSEPMSKIEPYWRQFVLEARWKSKTCELEQLERAANPDFAAIMNLRKEIREIQLQLERSLGTHAEFT